MYKSNKPAIIAKANLCFRSGFIKQIITLCYILIYLYPTEIIAATKTSTGNGNWGISGTWSPAGVPASGDDVIIASGHTITVDSIYSCNNLTIGNGTNANATVQITLAANSLTINGALSINPGNKSKTYVLNAGPGTLNIAGTISHWGTSGTNSVDVSSGTINFTPAVTLTNTRQDITFTDAGTINFYSSFTDQVNKLITYTGCTVNFHSSYTVNTTASSWAAKGTAYFANGSSLLSSSNLTLNDVVIAPVASVSIASSAGTLIMAGHLTIGSGATLTTAKDFEVGGNWINNGGVFSGGSYTITLNAASGIIGGASSTNFGNVHIGRVGGTTAVSYSMDNTNTMDYLVLNGSTVARHFALASGKVLTVNHDVTINQPTAAVTNSLAVNDGICEINGNLSFVGTNNITSRVSKIEVTGGSLDIAGSVTWMSNTAVATEVIAVSSGEITFGSSLTMGSGSGTLNVSGAGTVNFAGTSSPSFSLGGATAPSFTTANGCTLNFAKGFTNSNSALTLAPASQTIFTGSASITPNASITFGHFQINSGVTINLGGNIAVAGNWTNAGGSFAHGNNTVSLTGLANQEISATGGETFYKLVVTNIGSSITLMSDVLVTSDLTMNGPNINLNGYTFTLGHNSPAALSRTNGIMYGGTFKRWLPTSSITSTSGAYYGLFPIGTATGYRPVEINTTSNPTAPGYVIITHTDQLTTTQVNYIDNEGVSIKVISDKYSTISTSGLSGGTYNINVTFSDLSSSGNITDLYLGTYTGNVMGSAGNSVATTGSVSAPTVKRTGLSISQLANVWVIGSKNKSATPIRNNLFTRKSGNWNDVTIGNGTWSWVEGGAGVSCDCMPDLSDNVILSPGHTVTITNNASVNNVEISNGATLKDDGVATFVVTENLIMVETGKIENASVWSVGGAFAIPSTSASSSTGSLTLTGNMELDGELTIGSGTLNLGTGSEISGNGSIVTSGSGTVQISSSKTVATGSAITLGSISAPITLQIQGGVTLTNQGSVTVFGNITGSVTGSTWINASGSSVSVTGTFLSTGTLNASASNNTVEYSGSGNQTIKTPSSSYFNLTVSGAGIKSLSSGVTVDNVVEIKNDGILEQGTFVLSGTASLNMSGNAELRLERGSNGTYPELSGTYNLTGGTVTFKQNTASATLREAAYYNLKLTGSQPYSLINVTSIGNNLEILETASLSNNAESTIGGTLIYSTSSASSLSSNITVGGVSITSGTFADNGRTIVITGSAGWSKTGGTFNSTGTVSFVSSVAQEIGGSEACIFDHLTINNPAGVTLNVSPGAQTVISSMLTLTDGILYSSSDSRLRFLDGAEASGGSASSYVDGPVVKVGNDDFVFPLGRGGRFRMAGISGIVDVNTEVSAEYFDVAYSDLSPVSGELLEVSNQEFWMIDRAGSTDGVRIRLFWDGPNNVINCGGLKLAHWEAGEWKEETASVVPGSVCSYGGSGSIQTDGLITTFSPFTFGDGGGALPIKLVAFDAKPKDDKVLTTWSTALEVNNAYFTIERSADGETFEEVTRVDGANNSTTLLNYHAVDANPHPGLSYYRLKQTDFDGQYAYSNIVSVRRGESVGIELYPNPTERELFVNVKNVQGPVSVEIFNVAGNRVFANAYNFTEGNQTNTIHIPVREVLQAGMYFVMLETNGTRLQEKLIVR